MIWHRFCMCDFFPETISLFREVNLKSRYRLGPGQDWTFQSPSAGGGSRKTNPDFRDEKCSKNKFSEFVPESILDMPPPSPSPGRRGLRATLNVATSRAAGWTGQVLLRPACDCGSQPRTPSPSESDHQGHTRTILCSKSVQLYCGGCLWRGGGSA